VVLVLVPHNSNQSHSPWIQVAGQSLLGWWPPDSMLYCFCLNLQVVMAAAFGQRTLREALPIRYVPRVAPPCYFPRQRSGKVATHGRCFEHTTLTCNRMMLSVGAWDNHLHS